MALTNAKGIYDYIMSRPLPEKYSTPASIKNAYQGALSAGNYYVPQIDTAMRQYGAMQPITATQSYKQLVDTYNKEYKQNAALAAAEAVKASQAGNAGYGDTYSKAATDQAYTGYMADRGAAVPALMSAAAEAVARDKDALAQGINLMSAQRSANMQTAQKAYEDKWNNQKAALASRQTAYDTLISSLGDLYSYQYGIENPTTSGGSGGSGRRSRKSSSGYYYSDDDGDDTKPKPEPKPKSRSDSAQTKLYSAAIDNYPVLAGSLLTYNEYARRHGGNIRGYESYVKEQIEMAKRSERLNKNRGKR